MNREYLERKRKEYVATLAAEKPEAVLVSQKYQVKDEENPQEDDPLSENEVLGPGDWRETDNAEDGTPAIIADGPRAGTQITIQRPKNSENTEPKKVKTLAERKEAKTRQRKRKAIEMMIQAIKDGETSIPDRHIIYLMAACKGTRAVCGDHFDYKTQQTFNSLELPDKIMSFASLQNKDVSESAKIDLFFWESVCENIFTELGTGQSGPDEPRWAEAGIIASLVNYDLEKALADATAALSDPKSWEALEKSEKSQYTTTSGKTQPKNSFFLAFLFKIFNQTPMRMLLLVRDCCLIFFIKSCFACKIVFSCYIMVSKWFSAIHGGLRLFRG